MRMHLHHRYRCGLLAWGKAAISGMFTPEDGRLPHKGCGIMIRRALRLHRCKDVRGPALLKLHPADGAHGHSGCRLSIIQRDMAKVRTAAHRNREIVERGLVPVAEDALVIERDGSRDRTGGGAQQHAPDRLA